MTTSMAAMLAVASVGGSAHAQHGVDVRDLPPLPEVTARKETVEPVAVVAATLAGEQVVVGAAKREQSLGDVAHAVTVIPGDRLRRFGYRNVAEALRAVAGVYVVDDRMIERIGIRGLQLLGDFNTRVLLLIDGVPINEPFNQYVGIGDDMPVNIDQVDRIEVIRGPGSSFYGTNAFFGVINVITLAADKAPRVYGRISGGAPDNELRANAAFAVGDLDRSVRGSVGTKVRMGDSLTVPEVMEGTDADGERAFSASLVGTFDRLFAQVRAFRRERELPWAPYDSTIDDDTNRNVDEQVLVDVGYTRDLGDRFTLTVRGFFSRYRFEDYFDYGEDPEFRDVIDSTWAGGEVRGIANLLDRDRLSITIGSEVLFNDVQSNSFEVGFEDEGVTVPNDFHVEGVYASLDARPLPWLLLTAAGRFDANSQFENRISPRAAVLVSPRDDIGFKLLYGEGFRVPSPYEAFFDDGIDFVGNPELAPELIRAYEAVVWARPLRGATVRLSGFYWGMTDLIEQQEVDTPDGSRLQFENLAELNSLGLELEGQYRSTSGWLAFASGTFADVQRDDEAGEQAVNAPRFLAKGGVSTPRLMDIGHLSSELHVMDSRRSRDPDADADAFALWNVVAYFPDLNGFDVTVGVRNLIGTREQVPSQEDYDRDEGDTPIPLLRGDGRQFYVWLAYHY